MALSELSLSTAARGRRSSGRHLAPRLSFTDRSAQQFHRSRRARYTLLTDINDFYGSIYTHALEWALSGKSVSKAHLHAGGGGAPLAGANLDKFLRAGQEGQTKGIPIGPDTSLLAAEVLLCAADVDFVKAWPRAADSASRFMDDYQYSASSRAEAEDALFALDSILGSYEMSINSRKTLILDGAPSPRAKWAINLSRAALRRHSAKVLTNDLYSLFSTAFDEARANPGEPVLGYAIQRTRPTPRYLDAWEALVDLMSAAVMMDPSALRYMAARLDAGRASGMPIDVNKLSETIDSVLLFHAPLAHGSEVAWALSIARDFDCQVTSKAAGKVIEMEDNAALLLLRDLDACGQLQSPSPSFADAEARADSAGVLVSEDWLLGYEFARLSWSTGTAFRSSTKWGHLLGKNVAFYDAKSAPKTPSAALRRIPTRSPFGYS